MRGTAKTYIVRYKLHRGQLHPIVRFGLQAEVAAVQLTAYVDSGAAYSVFDTVWAARLGLKYKRGRLIRPTVADGRTIRVYLHRLKVLFGHHSFPATVGFSDQLGVGFNLLGRKDIFKRLSFTFNDYHQVLIVRDAREMSPELLSHAPSSTKTPARR